MMGSDSFKAQLPNTDRKMQRAPSITNGALCLPQHIVTQDSILFFPV